METTPKTEGGTTPAPDGRDPDAPEDAAAAHPRTRLRDIGNLLRYVKRRDEERGIG